jgi:hypothetical protein
LRRFSCASIQITVAGNSEQFRTIYSKVSTRNSVAASRLADKPGESIDFHGIVPGRDASQKGMFATAMEPQDGF